MFDLPAKEFEKVRAHPDEFAVITDSFGNKHVVHRRTPTPTWASATGCLMVVAAIVLFLGFISKLLLAL